MSYSPPIGIPNPVWGGMHPIDVENPTTPAEWPSTAVTGYYYVDSDHASSVDADNTYGYPDRPRKTIPTTLTAGSKVFMAKCVTNWSTTAAIGTEANPVWIIGTGAALWKPTAGGYTMRIRGSSAYLIIDGIVLDGSDTTAADGPAVFAIQNGPNHVCIRNCTWSNYPPPPWSDVRQGAAFFLTNSWVSCASGNVSHVVLYNLTCVGNGGGQFIDYETGQHCILITGDDVVYSTKHVWVLDSDLSEGSEDGLQIGTTSGGTPQANCDNIYIGRNSIRNNRENAIDIKCANKVVMSQNLFSGYKTPPGRVPGGSSSDGAAGVINNDGGGPAESWWIFNKIVDCHLGIRNQAAGGNHYLIGNIVNDMHLETGDSPASPGQVQGSFYVHDSPSSALIVNNTVYDVEMGVNIHNVGNAYVWGNIVSGIRNNGVGYPVFIDHSTSTSVGDNIYYDSDASVRQWLVAMSVANGDLIDVNPELINPPTNMGLSEGSPAINSTVETSVYATYEATFGESILFDFNGNPRPSSGAWDRGAIQYGSSSSNSPVTSRIRNQDFSRKVILVAFS